VFGVPGSSSVGVPGSSITTIAEKQGIKQSINLPKKFSKAPSTLRRGNLKTLLYFYS